MGESPKYKDRRGKKEKKMDIFPWNDDNSSSTERRLSFFFVNGATAEFNDVTKSRQASSFLYS